MYSVIFLSMFVDSELLQCGLYWKSYPFNDLWIFGVDIRKSVEVMDLPYCLRSNFYLCLVI